MDDRTLIQKIKEGDITAVRVLIENHKNLIWHIIVSMTGRNCDNEDLFQEVLFRTFKGIRSFREDAKLSTWIGSITHHVCVDYLRHRKRKAVIQNDEKQQKQILNMADDDKANIHGDISQILMKAIE